MEFVMSPYSVKFICVQYNRGWTCLDPHTPVYRSWSWDQEILGTNVKSYKWAYGRTDISHKIRYFFSSIATLLFRLAKMHVSTHVCWYPICSTPSFILKYYKNKQNISRRQTEEIDPVYDGQ
jgi:hypothetical protein